ncbi:L-fuculose-phosphate aldolase [Microbacterium phyllosphaerae]|uniref:L-fuculose-phosphate aldolase n=1 Tax=Microbacterium phyllosphaerae TaxID=124798 RepID=A0ABS4WKP9_9MICO|nr:class II aldolase/adducin family protein [Microbacterium phyllosphaerae]MBP2376771.1 L-fuculose-phosphate aldolase [Microbacterium phyllosphaerae]
MTSPIDDLIAAGARVAAAGISPGSSGNVSILADDLVYMTGTGTDLGRLSEDDIAVVTREGTFVRGAKPSKELALHLAFYEKNVGHTAVVHLHSPFAVAASCLEPWSETSAIPPLTPYFVMRVGQSPLVPFRVPGDPDLAAQLLALPHAFHGALLANHGQIVSATTLDAAIEAAIELEEACRITLLTDGKPRRLLPAEDVAALAARWGTPWAESAALVR